MIDHMSLPAPDTAAAVAFYERVLAPLGYGIAMEYDGAAGFGRDGKPVLWIVPAEVPPTPIHVAIVAADRAAVDAFHAAALAAGAADNGGPGLRPHYHPSYYAAFVRDPMGNNLEAVCHRPE
jgi:catechol 2,3-dioxygenase-like lactoylglutathione lyase family enzyme